MKTNNQHPTLAQPTSHSPAQAKRFGLLGLVPFLALVGLLFLFWHISPIASLVQTPETPQLVIRYASPTGSGTACTTGNPCSLQTAVTLSTNSTDEVHALEGIYTSPVGLPTLQITRTVTIIGGYFGSDWSGPDPALHPSTLDGEGERVVHIFNSANPTLEGFRIINGSIDNGAGIYIASGNATIRHNEIYNNAASNSGGAIFIVFGGATATIYANDIHDNTAGSNGGAIYVSALPSTAILDSNTIHHNNASQGAGLYVATGGSATAQNNMFYANDASTNGGAIKAFGIIQSWHNTIVANSASTGGAGIYLIGPSAQISHTIVASNTTSTGQSGIQRVSGTVTGNHNNLFNNTSDVSFPTDILLDPEFINLSIFNLHLRQTSPNVNAGGSSGVDQDIDEQARPNGTAVEVGADEFYANIPAFDFSPANTQAFANRGSTAVYSHRVTNLNSTEADTYTFICDNSRGWSVTCPMSQTVPLGGFVTVTTQFIVPGSATALMVADTLITATSQISPELSHPVLVRTVVNPIPGVQFTPNYSTTVPPGDVITLTHTLTNTGDAPDVFQITLEENSEGWAELAAGEPLAIPLGIGASAEVQLRVTVPPHAAGIIPNIAVIRATSQYTTAVYAEVEDLVRAEATIGTRYVRPSNSDDRNNNCTQVTLPCETIEHAIGQAVTNDEVHIGFGAEYVLMSSVQLNETIHLSGQWRHDFTAQLETETVIQPAGSFRLFELSGAANRSTFDHLTLKNGTANVSSGGAVLINSGVQAEFSHVAFENNEAERGGAVQINNNALAIIDSSRFVSNTATLRGGAIQVERGTAVIRNTLFDQNVSNGDGGAIYVLNGSATVNFNTIVNNTAVNGGGILVNNTAVGSFYLVNSILADNTAGSQGEAINVLNGGITGGYVNLWNNDTVGNVTLDPQYDLDPTFISSDPAFHLQANSPIVDIRPRDVGNPADELDVDFEGDSRPADQGFDLGYDELAGCSAKRDDTIYGSIQDAVDAEDPQSNLILVSGICRGVNAIDDGGQTIFQTVHITGSQSLIIQGGWDGNFEDRHPDQTTIVDPQGQGRALFVSAPVSVTLEFLTLRNGDATDLGGGPAAEDAGGLVYNQGATVMLRAVSMLTGTAVLGGGLYNDDGTLQTDLLVAESPAFVMPQNVDELQLRGEVQNGAATDGGAFYIQAGTVTINGAMVMTNTAVNGGGIYHAGGILTATNSVFAFNDVSGDGGAVYNSAAAPGATNLLHLTFYSNVAASEGGAVYNQGSDPIVIHSNIFQSNNAVAANGGDALFVTNAADEDYNYFNDQPAPVPTGVTLGADSINSTTPPGLLDPDNGEFHLGNEAPAIDVADPLSPVTTDFDDDPRPANQGPDMGADEVAGCRVELNGVIYGSIQAAMADAQTGDTIRVSGICSGVHPYDTGDPNGGGCHGDNGIIQTTVHIDQNVILQGGWDENFENQDEAYSVLDAKGLGRVIYIAPDITATVEGFTITGGSLSGLNGNGAGICIDENATPTIQNNHVMINAATRGGGIYSINSGAVIDGNWIHQNEATAQTPGNGGGVYAVADNGTAVSIWNNFIYSNTAQTNGGGFYNELGNHMFWHNTLVGNELPATPNSNQGAAVYVAAGNPEIRGNIFLNNDGPATDGVHCVGTANPLVTYNNSFGQTINYGGAACNDPNNLSLDPLLTVTYTLQLLSPMLDAGDPAMTLDHDFADEMRPSNLGFDIGADEIGGCVARNLDDPDVIYGSLQLAVDEADASGDTIEVDGVCLNAKSHPNSGDSIQNLFVDKSVTIDGDWASGLVPNSNLTATLNALDNGRVLYVAPSGVLTLTKIYLFNGDAAGAGLGNHGGGVYNVGTLLMDNVDLFGNTAVNGGGFYNNGGTAVITHTNRIYSNTVSGNGGGVYQNAGTIWLDGNHIHDNTAVNGGGVYLAGAGSEYVRNNFIYRNSAERGGGLYNQNTDAPIWHNTFYRNVANTEQGGGIYSSSGILIHSNIVDFSDGSGIHTVGGGAQIDYNNVVANFPSDYSGTAVAGANDISVPPFYEDAGSDDFHLRSYSAGVDVADPAVPFDYDIDGDLRPTNGGPEMGADEINSCLIRVIDPSTSVAHIFGVLQDAIDFAEGLPLADPELPTIEIARGECSGVRDDGGHLQVGSIRRDLVFEGSLRRLDFLYVGDYTSVEVGTVSTRIIAGNDGRVLYIHDGADPQFVHLAFVEGNANVAGGGGTNGGGILIPGTGSLEMRSSFVCDSTAVNGGGVYLDNDSSGSGTETYITGSSIGFCFPMHVDENPDGSVNRLASYYVPYPGNSASGSGGGLYSAGPMDMTNTGFLENSAGQNGGGLFNTAVDTRIINGIFYSNTAQLNGGGIYNSGANFSLYHNTITENSAQTGNGGGIRNESSATGFILNSSIIHANQAPLGSGSGLSMPDLNETLAYNNFFNNDSTVGVGSNHIPGDPDLFFLQPGMNSPVLDEADPTLLDPGVPDPDLGVLPIDFDADLVVRPDGGTPHTERVSPYQSDLGAFEWWKEFGCTVTQTPQQTTAVPGDEVTYFFNVTNTGFPYPPSLFRHGFTDILTITLDSSAGWSSLDGGDLQISPPLDWGDSIPLTLTVQVPVDAQSGQFDASIITCESWSNPDRTNTGQASTFVGLVSGVIVFPSFDDQGAPGDVLTFTHQVRNIGNETQDFVIRPDAGVQHASAVLLDASNNAITETFATLGSQEETTVTLQVTILDTALRDEYATPGVVAQQEDNPLVFGSEYNNILILGEPATRYVALGGQDDGNNCAVAAQPCGTIEHAIFAAEPGDSILVAEGIYDEASTHIIGGVPFTQTVFISKSVTIRGGYSTLDGFAVSHPITQPTRLDGEDVRRVLYISPSVTVTLSSLFVENGFAPNSGAPLYGGGIYNAEGNLTITSTFVLSNHARFGAGFYQAGNTLTVNSSVFAYNSDENVNSPDGAGGAVYLDGVTAVLENNTFVSNRVIGDDNGGGYGGAVYAGPNSSVTTLNNIFSDNDASDLGDAIFITTTAAIVNDYDLYWSNSGSISFTNYVTGPNSFVAAPEFQDAIFHLAPTSPAKDAGNDNTSRTWAFDYELGRRIEGPAIDIGADERVQRPGFTFTPITATAVITTAEVFTYPHVLQNTGDFDDSYNLEMLNVSVTPGGNWTHTLSPTASTGVIPYGESITVTLVIAGDVPGSIDQTTITATSTYSPTLMRQVTDTTTVEFIPGVDIEASQTGDGRPAIATVYNHVLTNTGDGFDQFDIHLTEAPPAGWLVTINPTQTGFLDADDTLPFTVSVTPPAGTPPGAVYTATVEASSMNTLGIEATDTLTDVTTVIESAGWLFIPDAQTQTTPDNSSVTFLHTLQNVGNVADGATLTVAGTPDTWAVTLEPTAVPVLAPLATIPVTVTVSVPPNSGGLVHTAVITATSTSDPAITATAVDTTTVLSTAGVLIEPDYTRNVDVPSIQTYTHTVTNLGNGVDTFDITAVSTLTWTTSVAPAAITLAPGLTGTVVVTVVVPADAEPDFPNVTTVRAESQSDPAVFDTAVDTTRARQQHSLLFEPDRTLFADPNTDIVFTHYLTNTGNGTDHFVLTAVTENNWPTAVPPGEIVLAPGAGTTVLITQTVPLGADGMMETMLVTATSTISPAISATVEDTTRVSGTAGTLGVVIEPDNSDSGAPGDSVSYAHTVTNTGDIGAAFALNVVSANGWAVTVTPDTVALLPNESAAVEVLVTIPVTAVIGAVDLVTVTAVAQAQSDVFDTALDTTTVTGTPTLDVIIEPDQSSTAAPGDTVQYQHLVTNTGTMTDEYGITAVSNQGWSIVTIPAPGSPIQLAPNESAVVTVRISVPLTATDGTVDVTTVTATSLADNTVSDIARDTTTVQAGQAGPPTLYLPIIMKPSSTPPTPTPTPTGTVPTPMATPTATSTQGTPTPSPTPCAPPTGIDLIVTQIQVVPGVPAAGQPATVFVTIRNQGTVNVPFGNNFFLDAYVDRTPQPFLVGDIVWGIQGADLTAGTSRTYSALYTFGGGTHQLWAQVDTDRNVNECPMENNNTYGPVTISVSGEPNGAGQSVEPQYGPRQTLEPVLPTPEGTPTLPPVVEPVPSATPTPSGTPSLSGDLSPVSTPTPTPP